MKTIQDYINRYSTIAKNLGYSGQSIEVLVQLLAQASYTSEIENASYMSEASLEKCSLINSKIQHCVDRMYSVFRGSCPRVIMKIRPTKYLSLNPYDKIIDSPSFNVHYLGYYQILDENNNIVRGDLENEESTKENKTENNSVTPIIKNKTESDIIDLTNIKESSNKKELVLDEDNNSEEFINKSLDELLINEKYKGKWQYSSATFYPVIDENDKTNEQIIIGLISPKRGNENLTIDEVISTSNTYYVECTSENLSDDVFIKLGSLGSDDLIKEDKTRLFSDHILTHKIFDLTIPGFGSRLYLANYYKDIVGRDSNDIEGITENSKIIAQYYGFSKLDDYSVSELKRLQLKGAELLQFNKVLNDSGDLVENPFLVHEGVTELNKGLCYIKEVERDSISTIHYKANRDRFVNSIMRSNSDIGTVLEESFPEYIINGGTSYLFNTSNSESKNSSIYLYYIPKNDNILISDNEIDRFKIEKRAYYIITTDISIFPGIKYTAAFNIDLELYKNSGNNDFNKEIGENILISNYEKKFGIIFNESCKKEIESLINKLPNVKKINGFNINYFDNSGKRFNPDISNSNTYYFNIKYTITTKISN